MSAARGIINDIQDRAQSTNPFNMTESSYSRRSLIGYRIATALSWLLLVVTSTYYTFASPNEGKYGRHTIWGQNSIRHTPFSLSAPIVTVYWIVLMTLQAIYLASFYPPTENNTTHVSLQLAPHFIAHNLLSFGFVHLWCRSYFWWALLLLVINFLQLTFAYFRFPPGKIDREGGDRGVVVHIAVLAGPLAWSFVALYWDGAAAVHARHVGARIVANVFVWSWPVYAGFYLVTFKDWAMGFSMSVLASSLGVGQFLLVIFALQWPFAFAIMGLLFIVSCAVAAPGIWGGEPFKRGLVVSSSSEREPLLQNGQNV